MVIAVFLFHTVQNGVCFRNRYLSSLPVFPDDDFRVLFVIVPDPFLVHTLGGCLPLYPDAAVACLGSKLRLVNTVIPVASFLTGDVRHLVQQVPVVEPDGPGAEHVVRIEAPRRGKLADLADQQVLTGTSLVVGLFRVRHAGGDQQGGEQPALPEDIQSLSQLVHHQPHLLIGQHRLQVFRRHISLHKRVPVQDRAVVEGR